MTRAKSKRIKDQERLTRHQQELALSRNIVLDYSWRDIINGEIVYTDQPCGKDPEGNIYTYKILLKNKLKQTFGFVPSHALNHEYGEVLNRFGT